ncbi:hypothetical protein BKA70DRAFT_684342 [Coprinopsis sp. MPI-PUGE-AT-0042]|nr:hypothetical protein BKA70DRAFT_684342 [Coprinopsis sp. MPI-PUGE-AT-0042]
MRPLTLHASALNNDEYEEYTRALRELGEVPEGETDEEEWYEHITLGVREVRAWLRGRYSSLSVGVLDQILKFLSPTLAVGDVVNGGQFFAVLRLMTHVQNGREVDRGLAFVQAHPQTQSNQPSLSSSPTKISAPRPPPPRRKRSATFDSAQHAQPPQHPSHHNLGQGVSAGLKSLVSRAVPPPPIPSASGPVSIPIPPPRRNNNNDDDDNNNAGGLSTSPSKSTGPPLPPRKPTLPAFPPPPPVHSQRPRSVSPKKSVTALPGERAPPPPPPRPANLPPVPSSSKPQMVSRGSYTSTSAGIGAASTPMSVVPTPFHTQQQPAAGGGQHQTSELMKQSLQASKAAQSLKRHEAEKEKERVMQVLKSSSRASTSSTGNSPWKPPKPVPLPPMMSKERSRDRERSPARPPFPPKPLSTSSISSLSDDGRRLATRSFHAPAPSVGYAPSAVSSTSRVSRSSMEQVALAGSEASGGLGRVPPPVPPLPSSHSHYSQAGPAPPTSSSSSTSTTGVSGGVQGRAPPPPPPPAHPDRKPVLPPRDRSTSRPRVSPGTPTTPGGVQRRHTVNHHHHSQSPSHSRYTQQRRGDESRERERYARLGDDEEDEESGSVGSFDEVYKTPFEGPLTPFGGPATPTPFGGASTLGGDEQDNQATIRGHGGDARTERMKRRHSAHNPFYTSGDVGVDSTGGSGVGLGVSGAGGILGAAGAGSGGGERAGGGAVEERQDILREAIIRGVGVRRLLLELGRMRRGGTVKEDQGGKTEKEKEKHRRVREGGCGGAIVCTSLGPREGGCLMWMGNLCLLLIGVTLLEGEIQKQRKKCWMEVRPLDARNLGRRVCVL